MGITVKKPEAPAETNNISYNVVVQSGDKGPKVITAEENKTFIIFNLIVNGVTINGCTYSSGISKKNEPYEVVSLPTREYKDKNGEIKTQSIAYFPIKNYKDQIVKDLELILNS